MAWRINVPVRRGRPFRRHEQQQIRFHKSRQTAVNEEVEEVERYRRDEEDAREGRRGGVVRSRLLLRILEARDDERRR